VTLCEKISLIDGLIRENPDTSINDYLETVKEIEGIRESAMVIIPKPVLNSETYNLKMRKTRNGFEAKYVTTAKLHRL
jgi:hypothetical protein